MAAQRCTPWPPEAHVTPWLESLVAPQGRRIGCLVRDTNKQIGCDAARLTLFLGANRKQLMHADLEKSPQKGRTNLAQVQACPVFLPRSPWRCEHYHNHYHLYKLQGLCFSLVNGEREPLSYDNIFPIYHGSHPIITHRLVTLQWTPSCIRIWMIDRA